MKVHCVDIFLHSFELSRTGIQGCELMKKHLMCECLSTFALALEGS